MTSNKSNDASQQSPLVTRELRKQPLMWLLCVCYFLCLGIVVGIFLTIVFKLNMSNSGEQITAVRLLQMTLGMLIGVTFAMLGVVAVWLGLIETTNVEVTGWGKAAATGPGGLLVICGTVVICMCLMREFKVITRTGVEPDLQNINQEDSPRKSAG